MEGKREDVETFLSVAWYMLRRQSGRSAAISSQALISIWPLFILFSQHSRMPPKGRD